MYHNSWNHGTNSFWSFKNIIQDKINKGILKFLGKKEAMVVAEDSFPLVASVNIATTDLRAILNEKEDEKFSLNVKIRKVWVPKQYLVYKDEMSVKGKVSIDREKEKNGRHPYHSKQEIKKRNPSKKRMFLQKKRHTFLEGKGRNTSRRKIPPRFVVPPLVPPEQSVSIKNFPKSSP